MCGAQATQDKNAAVAQAEKTANKASLAERLISGLAGEFQRWTQNIADFDAEEGENSSFKISNLNLQGTCLPRAVIYSRMSESLPVVSRKSGRGFPPGGGVRQLCSAIHSRVPCHAGFRAVGGGLAAAWGCHQPGQISTGAAGLRG